MLMPEMLIVLGNMLWWVLFVVAICFTIEKICSFVRDYKTHKLCILKQKIIQDHVTRDFQTILESAKQDGILYFTDGETMIYAMVIDIQGNKELAETVFNTIPDVKE